MVGRGGLPRTERSPADGRPGRPEVHVTERIPVTAPAPGAGCAGFIGTHLCAVLLDRGAQVTAVDNLLAN
ncbi:NAD-dependent epimerase/dehydratase family protein [Streptomyces corynorhini]|uniref:NAD-dependent epimerase/dehydratase family protein n=1 Tax=Streptomyces corynorhini TaxID=2282652 RepID=UPI002D7A3466|nr:NAD-dependent epimerase/dehydratase family protein [Streptomyces corynorhini]